MKNKKGKKLNSINFGFTEKSDVFINHDLTTENQSLYKKKQGILKKKKIINLLGFLMREKFSSENQIQAKFLILHRKKF